MLLLRVPIRHPSDAARTAVEPVSAAYSDRKALETVIYELCLNVLHWSRAQGTVFVEQLGECWLVTVQDDGVGIPETMRTRYPDLSNERAIDDAIKAGVTASGESWRGYGLGSALELTNRAGFSVHLSSRDIAVLMIDGRVILGGKSGGAVVGTIVQVSICPPPS